MKGRIISIMGIDGSGKSTLSIPLKNEIDKQGINTKRTWATLKPVLLKPAILITKFLFVRKHNKFDNYDRHIKAKKSGINKLKFAHKIYFLIMLLDYLPQAFFKVSLPKYFGKYVICDRYYYDLIIDYAITISLPKEQMSKYIHVIEFFLPKADTQYYLCVKPEVSYSRKDDIPSIEYLIERKSYYDYLAKELNIIILNGEAVPSGNCQIIMNELQEKELL